MSVVETFKGTLGSSVTAVLGEEKSGANCFLNEMLPWDGIGTAGVSIGEPAGTVAQAPSASSCATRSMSSSDIRGMAGGAEDVGPT